MKSKRSIILSAAAVLAVLFILILVFSDRILISAISKSKNLDITYSKMENHFYKAIVFTDLKVFDKKSGVGIVSARASLVPLWNWPALSETPINFHLYDVRFKKSEDQKEEGYDSISALVNLPFSGKWTYKEISGLARGVKNGVLLKDFRAVGSEISLKFNGEILNNNYIDADITIYFSAGLMRKVPDELSSVVLNDEPDGWKSLSVKLKGDYKSPNIQVSGKLFRLNIGTVSESKNPS